MPAHAREGDIAAGAIIVDEVDEDDRVVHHDAGESDGSHDGHEAHRFAHEEESENDTHDAEGHDGHDDERLHERIGDGGDEGVDEEDGDEAGEFHRFEAALGVLVFAGQADLQGGVCGEDLGQPCFDFLVGAGRGGDARVDVGGNGKDAFLVEAFDPRDAADALEGGDGVEVDHALRALDHEIAHDAGVLAVAFVHFHADDHFVIAPAQAGGLESAEGAEDIASDLGGVETGARGAVLVEAHAEFGFAFGEVAADVD